MAPRQPCAPLAQPQHPGAGVTAISLSDEQLAWARAHHPAVSFLKQDYRDTGQGAGARFDAIVSVEMVEALGREYWPDFMDCIARNLKPGGRARIKCDHIPEDDLGAYEGSADFMHA